MKILLTGGAGFIGTSLIKKLKDNHQIYVFDNLERNSLQNENFKNVTVVKGDITNYCAVNGLMNMLKPEIVIHMAAIAGVDNVIKRPVSVMDVNMIGTYNILKSIHISNFKNIKKFINFSTSEVYGSYSYKLGENEKTNLGSVGEARWSYSVSKLAGEHLCFAYHKEYDLPFISVRPFNIYGPNQVGEGAIQIFIKKCLTNEDIEIHDDGSQIRSWCYIDDAVDFLLKCIDSKKAIGHVLNMGNPEGTITTIGLAKRIVELTKSTSKIKFVKSPYVDVELRIPNIDKARELLNFEPKVSLDEGILRTYKWYKRRQEK
jgi:UDP-glucuronate decarboxylase